jgi:metal-dependent amidase/aminoacylase/carboxypeptidase family protein
VETTMRQLASATAEAMGCTAALDYRHLESPVINQDLALNRVARGAAEKLYGPDILRTAPVAMGSEDFSYFMEHIPASLFTFLGCYDQASGCVYPVHNEKFQIQEDILHIGAAQYAQFAADYLAQTPGGEDQ